ncbi:head GIN domain-containing protein [Mucilaginibacter ximonensis]|uniref:Head GIN domain-containing protein n=1 Tax=Mucilaginibacter ximonensis TaxID=538021 RepID=A0ABW5YGA5_9SPHI
MKTIKILVALVLFAAGQTFAANIEDRHLSGFHAIDAAASFDVYITQGRTESVKVEAPADVIKEVLTDVRGGTLNIHTKNHFGGWGNIFNHKKVVVYVTVTSIDDINLTGSGDIYFKDGLNTGNINIQITGSGDIQGKLTARVLNAGISGSGDLKLWGRAETQKVEISGSGDYTARDLNTATTTVSISGSGDASVYASATLNAQITGSGDITYGGNPKRVAKAKSGSGDISSW